MPDACCRLVFRLSPPLYKTMSEKYHSAIDSKAEIVYNRTKVYFALRGAAAAEITRIAMIIFQEVDFNVTDKEPQCFKMGR